MVFSSNYAKSFTPRPKSKNCTAPEVDLTHIPNFGVFPVCGHTRQGSIPARNHEYLENLVINLAKFLTTSITHMGCFIEEFKQKCISLNSFNLDIAENTLSGTKRAQLGPKLVISRSLSHSLSLLSLSLSLAVYHTQLFFSTASVISLLAQRYLSSGHFFHLVDNSLSVFSRYFCFFHVSWYRVTKKSVCNSNISAPRTSSQELFTYMFVPNICERSAAGRNFSSCYLWELKNSLAVTNHLVPFWHVLPSIYLTVLNTG